MPEFFSYGPEWFFRILEEDFPGFCDRPSARNLIRILLPLCHLREWICPEPVNDVKKSIKAKLVADRSSGERLYLKLDKMPEFQLIRALCNHSKHFENRHKSLDGKMAEYRGARADLARVGDRLDITHFVVEDKEVRDILFPVFRAYLEYFKPARTDES